MPEIPIEVIEQIKKRDLRNIAKQAAEGKALSSAQMKRLDAAATDVAGGDGAMLRVEPCHVGQDYLSQILGITDRRIRQLASQGVLTKVARGHYPFPGVVAEYCEYLRSGGEKDTSRLKERELELKCKRLEQTISEYDTARRDDIEADCWEEVADILAEYKSTITRMPVTDEQRDEMNKQLAEAIERVQARRANPNISDDQQED